MSNFKKVLKEIAKQEGISIKEVYREMQIAIDAGFFNPDPSIQAAWRNVPLLHGKPKPEDVIMYCVTKIKS